jgi:hypothetical protein
MLAKAACYFLTLALLAGALAGPADAIGTSSGPIRHLIYSFTYSSLSKETMHTSGIGGATDNGGEMGKPGPTTTGATESPSGSVDYSAGQNDRGTIDIDVMSVEQDTGLVVKVSELSDKDRDAAPATCVVYGNTNVVCDPNAKINAEEFAVIRLLGRSFVDPSQIDANNHWRVANTGPQLSVTSDYTIDKAASGILQITTQRVTQQGGALGFTANADGKITYDTNRTIPTAVFDDEITRSQEGSGQYNTTRVQTSFALASDSMAGNP